MERTLVTSYIVLLLTWSGCLYLAHSYDIYDVYSRPRSIQQYSEDVGDPLLLTPFIESSQIKEALALAAVTHTNFTGSSLNITSYSGYLTVDKIYNSNLFFWFFLSQNDPSSDPVLLWLQGGPGSSSLYAVFTENGPYVIDDELNLSYRDYTWTKNHSVLFIDNPAGTGFSFTNEGGYAENETKVGQDLFEGLLQFFQLFPELKQNDFFVSGESYGGHYIPAVCYYIDQHNPSGDNRINLKGLAIGNPIVDVRYQADHASYIYNLGLVDSIIVNVAEDLHTKLIEALDNGSYSKATTLFLEMRSTLQKTAEIPNVYNHQDILPRNDDQWEGFINQESVRREVHVGNRSFGATDNLVAHYLNADKSVGVGDWLAELINKYRVLLFNGQLDTMDPYPLMVNLIKNLNFTAKAEYLNATRKTWRVDDEVAGYAKTAGNFTEVLVRDAGHMVPADQPKWGFDLIFKFVRDLST